MRAHLVQLDIAWEDPQRNRARAAELIAGAAVDRGDLVLLPEMFDTGFSMNTGRTRDSGATLEFLCGLARERGVTVQGGRTVRDGAKARNRMTIAGPDGRVAAEYDKIHPFSLGKEHEAFEGGKEIVTYRWGVAAGLTVCPAICYDLRFPELFRIGLSRGAELYAIGACWPESRQPHWRALLIARAIENQAFVLGANRTGQDPERVYAGGSIAVGPRGEVIGELGAEERVLSVKIDPADVHAWRSKFPAWKDGRLMDKWSK